MAESEHGSVTHNIDLARGGDRDAKAWLWERYRRLLYTMAHDRSDDDTRSGANDTSDVVGEVGVRLSKGDLFDNVKDRKHFQLLLRQVVRGKAIDLQRREAARPTIPFGDEEALHPVAEDLDFRLAEMEELKDVLPLHLYETVLAYMECGNERDTAEKLGITRHELRIRVGEIRDIWSKHLGEE